MLSVGSINRKYNIYFITLWRQLFDSYTREQRFRPSTDGYRKTIKYFPIKRIRRGIISLIFRFKNPSTSTAVTLKDTAKNNYHIVNHVTACGCDAGESGIIEGHKILNVLNVKRECRAECSNRKRKLMYINKPSAVWWNFPREEKKRGGYSKRHLKQQGVRIVET